MLTSRIFSVQLFFLILENSFPWDGCASEYGWRCGDACISDIAECKCGKTIFGHRDQLWCCHKSCSGKGNSMVNKYGMVWYGEKEGNRIIGAECIGRALNLTEACDQKCNYYEEDRYRNRGDVLRSHMPCNASHLNITECLQEAKMRDGKYDCRN